MVERKPAFALPCVAIPDLPGWGDCKPALTPFAVSPWGSMDRTLSYTAFGLGEGILATKVRCAAAFIRELAEREAIPTERVILIGRGLGGVVAVLAGALAGGGVHVATYQSLASFQLLLEEEYYDWPAEAFLPSALLFLDIPDILNGLANSGASCTAINPLDGKRRELASEAWSLHCSRAERVAVFHGCDDKNAIDIMLREISALSGT